MVMICAYVFTRCWVNVLPWLSWPASPLSELRMLTNIWLLAT